MFKPKTMVTADEKEERIMVKKRNIISSIVLIMVITTALIFMVGCGSKETAPEDRVYLEGSDIDAAISDGDAYKGKWIKVVGKVFNVDTDGDNIAIQAWYDPVNASQPFMVYATKDIAGSVNNDEYISVDGKISGVFSGENMMGSEVKNLLIEADSLKVGTYDELYAPAENTKTVGETQDQHGVKVTLDRIEYAKGEARVYISVQNDSGEKASIYTFDSKAIQDGKQFDHEENYEAGNDDMGEILDGASKEGVIRFKGLDPDKQVKIQIKAFSDI